MLISNFNKKILLLLLLVILSGNACAVEYLDKISDEALYAYNVYQIEGEGRSLFSNIEGNEDTIMGLPVKKIKEYISTL